MKPHTVTLEEFRDWREKEEFTFASSSRERKRLVVTAWGDLRVYVGSEVVYAGVNPYLAVEAYNDITEKYIDKDFRL